MKLLGWTFRFTCYLFFFWCPDIHLPHNRTIGFVCGSHRWGQERWFCLTLVTRGDKTTDPSLSLFLFHFAPVIYLSSAVPPNEAKEKKLAECCIGLIDGVIKVARYRLTRSDTLAPAFSSVCYWDGYLHWPRWLTDRRRSSTILIWLDDNWKVLCGMFWPAL